MPVNRTKHKHESSTFPEVVYAPMLRSRLKDCGGNASKKLKKGDASESRAFPFGLLAYASRTVGKLR
jgi:hypothetical protein